MLHYFLIVLSAYYNINPNNIDVVQSNSLFNYVPQSNTINIFAQNVIINPYQVVYVPCVIVEPIMVVVNGLSGSNDECNLSVSIPHQNNAESERLYTSTDFNTEEGINYVTHLEQTLQNFVLDEYTREECPMYQPILENKENLTFINETQQIEATSIEVINFQKNSYLSNELVGHNETIQEESFICNNPTRTARKAEDNYYIMFNQEKDDICVGNITESTHQDIKNESFRDQQYKKSINESNKHLLEEECDKDNKFDHKQENINKTNLVSKTSVNSYREVFCIESIVNNVFKQDQEYEKSTQDISYANCGDPIKSKEINNTKTISKDFFTNPTGKDTSEQARSQYLFNSNFNKPIGHNRSSSNNYNQKIHIISSKIIQPPNQKSNKNTSIKALKNTKFIECCLTTEKIKENQTNRTEILDDSGNDPSSKKPRLKFIKDTSTSNKNKNGIRVVSNSCVNNNETQCVASRIGQSLKIFEPKNLKKEMKKKQEEILKVILILNLQKQILLRLKKK